jgi:hypothetical protein
MKIQALWIIADDTFEEGIAIFGGSKARLHLLACNISILSTMQSAAMLVPQYLHAQVHREQRNLPPHTAPLTASMHLLASSGRLKVMYALPVGPFRLTEDPYGPILFTDICFTIFPKAPKYSDPMRVSS